MSRRARRMRGWWGGLALGLVLALVACRPTPEVTPTAAPPQAPSPTVAAPTATTAVALPTATVGGLPPPPESPWLDLAQTAFRVRTSADMVSTVAEVWDVPTGEVLMEDESGALYTPAGDAYALNVYERPFTPVTQDVFWPDLDIRYARVAREGDWLYALIELHGLRPGDQPLTGEYGLELDLNIDGRGDVLLWARGPWSPTWSTQGVAVYADPNHDVGDAQACASDAPNRASDGYEAVLWRDGQGDLPGAAWVRARLQDGHPTIEFAFPAAWVSREQPMFLWRAWADAQLHDPARMDYHDTFTAEQAGSPYTGHPHVDAIAQADNTCYTPFGYRPLGIEPCLCRSADPLHPLCPAPPEAPVDGCQDLGGGWMQCTVDDQGQSLNRYCHWDPVLCRWDCRGTPVCFGTDDLGALAAHYQAFVEQLTRSAESGHLRAWVQLPNDHTQAYRCYVEDDGQVTCTSVTLREGQPVSEGPPIPNELFCLEVCAPDFRCEMKCSEAPTADMVEWAMSETADIAAQNPEAFGSPTAARWYCSWDATLCRYTCGHEQWCVDPKRTLDAIITEDAQKRGNCTYDGQVYRCGDDLTCLVAPDGSFLRCDLTSPGDGGGMGMEVVEWHYDPLTCTFQQQTVCGFLPLPYESCEREAEHTWVCDVVDCTRDPHLCEGMPPGQGPPQMHCHWYSEWCAWVCVDCEVPDESCFYIEDRTPPWVCPGIGEFDNCVWSEEECRWSCVGIHLPPGEEGGEEECQPADYCQEYATGVWVCDDNWGGPFYKRCEYDGCQWICDGEPVP